MLKVEDMHVYYGAIHAVKGVSFEVGDGEIVALIGANGAGKSTILKTVSGLMHPRSGSITLWIRTSPIPMPTNCCGTAWLMFPKAAVFSCR